MQPLLTAALLALVATARGQSPAPVPEQAPVLSSNTLCREAPSATHEYCGLPVALANFQGESTTLRQDVRGLDQP